MRELIALFKRPQVPAKVANPSSKSKYEATSIFLAEYEFVSQLIPFYRQIEMAALGGTAGAVGAVVVAISALESGNSPDPEAEATLLSLAAWITVFLLLIQIMALTRIRRASLYIKKILAPLGRELTDEERLLQWETTHSRTLQDAHEGSLSRAAIGVFVTSVPVTLAILSPAVAMPIVAAAIHPDGPDSPVLVAGYLAFLISIAVAVYGVSLSWSHERVASTQRPKASPQGVQTPSAAAKPPSRRRSE